MKIAFFASSLVSAYWNGAATYYRGLLRALAGRGHEICFYEPDAFDRQRHRDMPDPPWARVVVYSPTEQAALAAVDAARSADLLVKASGVGVNDALLEAAVLGQRRPGALVAFWDVDAPATLARLAQDPCDPFHRLIPGYDLVFTYGGGPPVVAGYRRLGAQKCVPIYNAADPLTHHPVPRDPRFDGDLGFLGNRLPDRERRVDELLLAAAARLPERRFLLGGAGWQGKPLPQNLTWLGHVYSCDHNAFNVGCRAVLNVCRDSMAATGFSPATRVFEAAAAGACLITDAWEGIERFLEPGEEVLVARDGAEVAEALERLRPEQSRAIGERARRRVLAEHTYEHRAVDVERALDAQAASARGNGNGHGGCRRRVQGRIVLLGLSITSSWGNGHATTYRGLVRALASRGHELLFLERDVPWYAQHRDLPHPPYARTALYRDLDELRHRFTHEVRAADLVLVGSYVPDGAEVGDWVLAEARGLAGFYDLDTPVTLAALAGGGCDYLRADQIPGYRLYLSFAGGESLERLERVHRSPCARALYCSADPTEYYLERLSPRWDLGYMGTHSPDRQPALEQLLFEPARRLPAGRFVVVGAQYPETVTWPERIDRIRHLPPPEHRHFYNRLRFALNLTRREMVRAGHAPSVRLFEAAACGVPIISDVWPGIEELFEPGRELLLARDAGDVQRALAELSDAARAEIGARARARVLAEHTPTHRARELERCVSEASALPAPRPEPGADAPGAAAAPV